MCAGARRALAVLCGLKRDLPGFSGIGSSALNLHAGPLGALADGRGKRLSAGVVPNITKTAISRVTRRFRRDFIPVIFGDPHLERRLAPEVLRE